MITITILTKNNENIISKSLNSVKRFEEVIILDSGSNDKTLEIAKKYSNVKVFTFDFIGFGQMRNKAAELATNDWILALDSDEEVSDELFLEISKLLLNQNEVYSIPFHNFYNEKLITSCGWYPEYHLRLYNKKITSFDDALVHEGIRNHNLSIKKLKSPINHYSYRSIDDFLIKMHAYSSLFAKQNYLKKKSSLLKAIFHSIFAFFKGYIIKKGIFQGKEGFIICIYNANTAFYKYLKLYEMNKSKR